MLWHVGATCLLPLVREESVIGGVGGGRAL